MAVFRAKFFCPISGRGARRKISGYILPQIGPMRKAGILPGIGTGAESFMDGGAPNTRIAVCDAGVHEVYTFEMSQ